jgi:hypothetical protein
MVGHGIVAIIVTETVDKGISEYELNEIGRGSAVDGSLERRI